MIQPAFTADVSVKIDMTKMVRMSIHIERLVLDGLPVDRSDGPAVKAAVEEELKRLLDNWHQLGMPLKSSSIASINGRDMRILIDADHFIVGRQIAQSIYGGIFE